MRDSLPLVLPEWSANLRGYYWYIRVNGRNSAVRRRYYRLVEKEKLRLAELGIRQDVINLICQYLHGLKKSKAQRLALLLVSEPVQIEINFAR